MVWCGLNFPNIYANYYYYYYLYAYMNVCSLYMYRQYRSVYIGHLINILIYYIYTHTHKDKRTYGITMHFGAQYCDDTWG